MDIELQEILRSSVAIYRIMGILPSVTIYRHWAAKDSYWKMLPVFILLFYI